MTLPGFLPPARQLRLKSQRLAALRSDAVLTLRLRFIHLLPAFRCFTCKISPVSPIEPALIEIMIQIYCHVCRFRLHAACHTLRDIDMAYARGACFIIEANAGAGGRHMRHLPYHYVNCQKYASIDDVISTAEPWQRLHTHVNTIRLLSLEARSRLAAPPSALLLWNNIAIGQCYYAAYLFTALINRLGGDTIQLFIRPRYAGAEMPIIGGSA